MTDRQRIDRTYKKVQMKHPQVTEKEKIVELAIRYDKRMLLLQSFAWLTGAVVCFVLFLALPGSTEINSVRYIFLIMAGSGVFEFFRTLGRIKLVEPRYRPVIQVRDEGLLTLKQIQKDGKSVFMQYGDQFYIVRECLYDKEDEIDTGLDNEIHHIYHLYFHIGDNRDVTKFTVKKSVYTNATIGTPFYVVLTTGKQIACIYQATNWEIGEEIKPCMMEKEKETVPAEAYAPVQNEMPVEVQIPVKTKKLLPILSMALLAVSFLMPVIIGGPLAIAGLVLAIIGFVKQKSKLSGIALAVCIVLFILVALSVYMIFAEALAASA